MRHLIPKPRWLLAPVIALGASGCESERDEPLVPAVAVDGEVAEPERLTDDEIEIAVEREMFYDPAVPSAEVDADVTDGIVALTGTVPHLLARERAIRVAESVKGVRAVSPQVVAEPVERSDAEIHSDVTAALNANPATADLDLEITVEDSMVRVEGQADSWTRSKLVERTVMAVRGVREVVNRVGISYDRPRSDREIANDVARRLRWDTLVNDQQIDVDVDNGVVELSGIVGSAAERRRAAFDAWVTGTRKVDSDGLRVRWFAIDEELRQQKYARRSDAEIRSAIEAALRLDPRVASYNIEPVVESPLVTLKGEVDNMLARLAAEQIARHTVGVGDVRNQIEIEPPPRISAARLLRELDAALARDALTEAHEIRLTVSPEGEVKMTGTVDSYAEKAEATRIANQTPGVTAVVNALLVRTPSPFTYDPYVYPYEPYSEDWSSYTWSRPTEHDLEIQRDIENELYWSPFVDAGEVEVRVVGGRATLTGAVDSWREHEAATENALEGGAVVVDNDLRVN